MSSINSTTDFQYIGLIQDIIRDGADSDDRTGVGTKSLFGRQLTIPINGNQLPVIGTRRVAPRIAFEELMFMLKGKHQTKELEAKNVNIWKGNTTREFLDDRGLNNLEEGDFGRMYGVQLREFHGVVDNGQVLDQFDQLEYMVEEIKTNPTSRRIIATHYNPAEADQGALFPCHIMTQFNVDVNTKEIDCLFWMRSSDVGYGLPYNLMYYSFFLMMVGKLTGYKPRNLIYQAGDCHLYKDQIECGMIEYMINNYRGCTEAMPVEAHINKPIHTLEDMLSMEWSDIEVRGYNPFPDFKNKPAMAV